MHQKWGSHAVLGLVGLLVGLAVALGFASPSDRIKAVEAVTKEIQQHITAHEIEFGKVNTKLDYLADGIDDLLGRDHRKHR